MSVSGYDTTYWDFANQRLTSKTGVTSLEIDTINATVIQADKIGVGDYTGNYVTLQSDTFYTMKDTAANILNGLWASDGADLQAYWLPWDSLPGGDTSYFDYAANTVTTKTDVYNMVINEDLSVGDTITVGESGGTPGVLNIANSDGDIAHFFVLDNQIEITRTDIAGGLALFGGAASGNGSFASYSSTSAGTGSVALGFQARADETAGVAFGYKSRSRYRGGLTQASYSFLAVGDAQTTTATVVRSVTHADATWYELYTAGASGRLIVPASTAWFFRADIIATNTTQDTTMSYTITGHIIRDAANSTTLLATTPTQHYETNTNYSVRATADDTNEALLIEVQLTSGHTGASTAIQWVSRIELTEVTF